MELPVQLQVPEEELLEFPEIDSSAGEAASSAEASDHTAFKPEKLQYRRPVASPQTPIGRRPVAYGRRPVLYGRRPVAYGRRPDASQQNSIAGRPVDWPNFEHRKLKDNQTTLHIPSIFDIQTRPDLKDLWKDPYPPEST